MWDLTWLVRLIHNLAAAAWVGGSLMYLFVVIPSIRSEGQVVPGLMVTIARRFKQLVNICTSLLILSGVYLTVERLTQPLLGWSYFAVLVIKIITAIAIFFCAFYLGQSHIRRLAKRVSPFTRIAPRVMLILGILVFLLGALLNYLYEQALAPR